MPSTADLLLGSPLYKDSLQADIQATCWKLFVLVDKFGHGQACDSLSTRQTPYAIASLLGAIGPYSTEMGYPGLKTYIARCRFWLALTGDTDSARWSSGEAVRLSVASSDRRQHTLYLVRAQALMQLAAELETTNPYSHHRIRIFSGTPIDDGEAHMRWQELNTLAQLNMTSILLTLRGEPSC